MPTAIEQAGSDDVTIPEILDRQLRWLSSWTVHNANHVRVKRDGMKVGGHQASCASMTAIMAALYFHALRPQDKVAVKPHAGPVLHAIHYMLGNQSLDQLQRFRGLGGMQSYPSRTKDQIPVDFSTGSVGLGVAITAFASLVQDYLIAHGQLAKAAAGRMIALMGDAELDEGNIYECLIEGYKHDIRNCWWVVDYNRQSLDHTTADRMFRRFDDIFETCDWRVTYAFDHMQKPEGSSVYLRLSTRSIAQVERADDAWEAEALKGAYWLKQPGPDAEAAIVFTGAIAPEALAAWADLIDDIPGLGLLDVTSPDLLHRGWSAQRAARWTSEPYAPSYVEYLLSALAPGAGLVTVIDGSPGALSWLGGVKGMRVSPLGIDRFGQTGDLPDLYRTYRLDADAIVEAAAELFVGN
jgi:pyruvate dehydrogenase complex dehydrogenase (E1) component